MKRGIIYTILAILLGAGCITGQREEVPDNREAVVLSLEQASHLAKLLKLFPELPESGKIRQKLLENITAANIPTEIEYFMRSTETSYERTYGWAWLLKLAEELHTWDKPLGRELEQNLQPLTELVVERYLTFLPKLIYPIRVGEHTNTAFGMSFAWKRLI